MRLPPPDRWTLAAEVDAKLRLAGYLEDDPALIRIREHNALAWERRDSGRHRDSGSADRGRGTDRGGNSPGGTVETRQRAGARKPTAGARLRAV